MTTQADSWQDRAKAALVKQRQEDQEYLEQEAAKLDWRRRTWLVTRLKEVLDIDIDPGDPRIVPWQEYGKQINIDGIDFVVKAWNQSYSKYDYNLQILHTFPCGCWLLSRDLLNLQLVARELEEPMPLREHNEDCPESRPVSTFVHSPLPIDPYRKQVEMTAQAIADLLNLAGFTLGGSE